MDVARLVDVREAYKERDQLQQKIIEFELLRYSPRGTDYGSERVQTSARGDLQTETLIALESLLERYDKKLRECVMLISEFEDALERLNARERRIMRMYFIDCMTWEEISVSEYMSLMQVHRIRRCATVKMEG